jgi:hypothetical protein
MEHITTTTVRPAPLVGVLHTTKVYVTPRYFSELCGHCKHRDKRPEVCDKCAQANTP